MKLFATLNMNRRGLKDNTAIELQFTDKEKVHAKEGKCSDCGAAEILNKAYFGVTMGKYLMLPK